jgi:hypothetical protein
MCCFAFPTPTSLFARLFTAPIRVRATQIFARRDGDQQLLAYAMNLRARSDVAMILPLPVPPGSDEADVQFIDLSAAHDLFALLHQAFMPPVLPAAKSRGGLSLDLPSRSRPPLIIKQVGAFEASFVPTVHDFDRLDPRFRLPPTVWSELPVHDHGFAVFKLRQTAGEVRIHPMGLRFPTRDPARIFFPTIHIHDGKVHKHARFDHALFYQREDGSISPGHDTPSFPDLVRRAADLSPGLVHHEWPMARATLSGRRANVDTWL